MDDRILKPLGGVRPNSLQRGSQWEKVLPEIGRRGKLRNHTDEVAADLLSGHAIIHLTGSSEAYALMCYGGPKRQPTDPHVERTVRGSRLSFVENLNDNIGMIRLFIQDPALRIHRLKIGRRTGTDGAVIYLNNLADPGLVEEVKQRLGRIEIDGVLDSGYLEQLITDNRWSVLPLTQATERPDKVAAALLEGRVALAVNCSPNLIIVPVTVNDLYQSPDDYYWGFWFGSFLRFFRILGNNIAVALPGLYVALLGVNPEALPVTFALVVSGGRMGVAFPLIIELLLIEFTLEIFREASLRLPQTVSQTLGVTTGIVLGIAAVGAGLVSNATLVVSVVTAIASYSGPDYGIGLSWRILKYILVIAAALFGLVGLVAAGIAILGYAASQNSFGVAYLAPWSPIHGVELLDTVLRRPLWIPRRFATYHPTDEVRYREKGAADIGSGRREDE